MEMRTAYLFQSPGVRLADPHASQIHILHTIRGLQERGHEAVFVGLDGRRVFCTSDLNVFREKSEVDACGKLGITKTIPFRFFESGVRRTQTELKLPYFGLFDSYRIVDACQQNLSGYNLIHERYNLFALGGAMASKKLGIKFVLEVNADQIEQRDYQGTPERGLRRIYGEWATRFAYRAADKIICVSAELKEHLISKYNLDPNKLVVLPCAADVEAFGRVYDSKKIKTRLGLNGEPVVMWVGGFFAWHNLDFLVDTFKLVVEHAPGAKLIMVGDGRTRSAVERKIRESALENSIILTGSVPYDRVPEIVSIADVAVAPTLSFFPGSGGTPLKLFEYMAACKPIVATRISQAEAVIRNGYNGWLIEPGDRIGFANAVVQLLDNPDERKQIAEHGRKQAVKLHSWERYAELLEEIYLGILHNK